MTREELDLLYEVKDEYWVEFSKLVNRSLKRVPVELRDHLLAMLGEASSVYGRNTDD